MTDSSPTQLARTAYEILSPAGSGGSAEVYRARAHPSGRSVALKIAHQPNHPSAAPLAREAMYAALALSPHLPELIDVGFALVEGTRVRVLDANARPDDARPFLALTWVEGTTLEREPPPHVAHVAHVDHVERALRVACDVGDALADLQALGLAHGDLKPENMIVDHAGRVHVLDLGLACPMHETSIQGFTPRYLARTDPALGDARARDSIALGALLAELVDADIARAEDVIEAARHAQLPAPLDAICAALLAPTPWARPSAAWVADTARRGLSAHTNDDDDRAERDARRVRATYLRLRRDELAHARGARDDTAPWLSEAVAQAKRANAIDRFPPTSHQEANELLGPLPPEDLGRWLTALVGSAAAAWPLRDLCAVPERQLAESLTALAQKLPPAAWTYAHVIDASSKGVGPIGAVGAEPLVRTGPCPGAEPLVSGRPYPGVATIGSVGAKPLVRGRPCRPGPVEMAMAIARVPPDPLALECVEQDPELPPPLALAAADALRLAGQYGRARSLILRESARGTPEAFAIAADILRRAGDLALAEHSARRAIHDSADPHGRARAALARIALDRGDIDHATDIAAPPNTAATCEVLALAASTRGDISEARRILDRGQALATTPEERARLSGARGYIEHTRDPAAANRAYAAAVDHAVRAGAILEEATYRTGEAAAAVSLGELDRAIATGRRAALLWEHLGHPARTATALVALAAAYATAGIPLEATRAARAAITHARQSANTYAEAYASWAIADTAPPGDPRGLTAAEHAAHLLHDAAPEDQLRAAARLLRHRSSALDPARIAELDRIALATSSLSPDAPLDWWGARAFRLLDQAPDDDTSTTVLTAITPLTDARTPIATRGPALAAAYELAARNGRGDLAQRLLSALGDTARELIQRTGPEFHDAVRALPWVGRASTTPDTIRPEQAHELEALIRSFSERERLGPLLNRIVDALVLWTGVERGLLLLRAPDDRLVPRAARNLARADLRGEQMNLSQTLARRALEAREPVIAVDAAGELPLVHHSVHALKLRSVLAVPLIARGEPIGVAYLDDRVRRGAFGPRELAFARTIASLAALVIADARDQVLLRRAALKAKRASARLAETLSLREAALEVAERELAKTRGGRGTRFSYERIIGESPKIQAMLKIVDRVTLSDVPVLIHGESGSGKELIARAIHDNGPRAARPFVSENCGAIPEGLLESTLFGHVRGAFTGASMSRAGLFEVAHRGTLFLDEIGEMSLGMQTKLLRVLEDGMVRPVGGERARKVDVRVIAATNRDLEAMVKARTFREDLFYRLNIITIRIPPLRERQDDIPLLVQHLIEKHGDKGRARVTPAAMARLVAYPFPGNVRQLENEIRRALLLSDGVIDEVHLSTELRGVSAPPPELGLNVRLRIDALERELVQEALGRTLGNQTQAAKLLGLSRFGLQKMIKRLQIH